MARPARQGIITGMKRATAAGVKAPSRSKAMASADNTPTDAAQPGLFDSVFHEVDEAIAIVASNGQRVAPIVVDVNRQFERQIGYRRDEVCGNPLFSLLAVNRSHGRRAMREIERAVEHGKPAVVIVDVIGKQQEPQPVELTVRPYASTASHGNFVCIMRAKSAWRTEDAATREITNRILTFLSHDLRTPLNGILGFSEIMTSGLLGPLQAEEYRAYARDIHAAGQDLLRLINGLLDLSHSEDGRFELFDHEFSLKACVEAVVAAMAGKAAAAKLQLALDSADALPMFRGDEARIRQVLMVLVSNAIKFTPEGGRIQLSLRRGKVGAEISCRDTGVGIAKNELACAFQPYRRIEDTYTNPKAGIGVGLPLAKVLIEQHGGSVNIASTKGEGTAVTIRLPAERFID